MTKIMPCTCANPFQDWLYGGKRLHNETTKENTWRCTVCGNVKGRLGVKAKALT